MGDDPVERSSSSTTGDLVYGMHRGLAGDGFLTSQLPQGVRMTEIADPPPSALSRRRQPVTPSRPTQQALPWSTSAPEY